MAQREELAHILIVGTLVQNGVVKTIFILVDAPKPDRCANKPVVRVRCDGATQTLNWALTLAPSPGRPQVRLPCRSSGRQR